LNFRAEGTPSAVRRRAEHRGVTRIFIAQILPQLLGAARGAENETQQTRRRETLSRLYALAANEKGRESTWLNSIQQLDT
jgi:hypothetical protein